MKFRVFDTEGDNLNIKTTKLYNLCYTEDGKDFFYTTDYEVMKEKFSEPDVLWVANNAVDHDLRACNKVLGTSLKYTQFVDTLAVSWFLYPDRRSHSLEAWGDDLGIKKVEVQKHEWAIGDPELMKSRVITDVKINWKMWEKANKRLDEIYGSDVEGKLRFLRYLSFKMDCLAEQEENPLKIDRTKAKKHYDELHTIVEEQTDKLRSVMPKKAVTKTKAIPKVLYKKDGTLSSHGKGWFDLLREQGLPEDTTEPVTYIVDWEEGNPNSDPQLKEWLFSLGWEPCTYKFVRDKKTGDERKIPQVRYYSQNDPRKGELTDSVKALVKKIPELESLDGLTVAKHRMKIFEAFLTYSDDAGNVVSRAGGFTNTMRLKHRLPIVNLPKAISSVAYGEEIRGCIIPQEGFVFCGSDVSSLEDMTKRHLIYDLDPAFVIEMNADGYDPHCAISVQAGKMTEDEYEFFKWYKAKGK